MKGTTAFLAVDLSLFDDLIGPLIAGRKVNPEAYLARALQVRRSYSRARCFADSLELLLVESAPPELEAGAGILRKMKFQLDRFDHKVDKLHERARELVDSDLFLAGRPFFITEASANGVVEQVDAYVAATTDERLDALAAEQMRRLDPEIASGAEPTDGGDLSADLTYRADLLKALKDLYDIAIAARRGDRWGESPDGSQRPAMEVLLEEVPWRAVQAHSRAVPFWIGRDVDGLETVCKAAGVAPPEFTVPAWRLLSEACVEFPDLRESLHLEARGPRDVGPFVPAEDVPQLLAYLSSEGARIIQVATRYGEGPACTTLLKKMRECATYAERHGMGYLEASGITPPDLPEEAQVTAAS